MNLLTESAHLFILVVMNLRINFSVHFCYGPVVYDVLLRSNFTISFIPLFYFPTTFAMTNQSTYALELGGT